MSNSDLKVLMMGGRRCGKTAVLSSLFYQIINGDANNIFTLCDKTDYNLNKINEETDNPEIIDVLDNKRLELTDTIETGGNRTFIIDQNPTSNYWDYTLQVQLAKKPKQYLNIIFRDAAGEYFETNSAHRNETLQFMSECDVFVIAVDTPYLMSSRQVIAEAANRISDMHTFLSEINLQGKPGEKMVIFVPVKCEKWMAEGKIDDVIAKIREYYGVSIKALDRAGNVKMSIIAVETAGGIHFVELRDAYTLFKPGWVKPKKCACMEDDESVVILQDGRPHPVRSDESVESDMNAIFAGTNIPRPNAWYHIPKGATYAPHNCDQLPLHILRFLFNKKLESMPGGVFDWLKELFGHMTLGDMRDALTAVAPQIRDSGDGIVHIKR